MKTCAIIIPAFNADEYIYTCYNSVLKQDKKDGWIYDIRIGVDGCEKTAEALTGIKYFYSDKNVGAYIMRNSLMSIEDADAYCYFDADDVMHPAFISECLKKIEQGNEIVMPAKIQCDKNLIPLKSKAILQSGGAMVFTHKVLKSLGGFAPYRCAADTDFIKRAEMAGYDIYKIKDALYYRRIHGENLTHKEETKHGSNYRRESWEKMTKKRENGEIKINPEITELKLIEPEKSEVPPVYILIRTSGRPKYFKTMMESVKSQTYKNIITIVHTDDPRDTYIEGDIIVKGNRFSPLEGKAPYNLYNNRLLDSIPEEPGYYCFLDDDDMYTEPRAIEKFVSQCEEDKINVCRVIRWNKTIYPKKWKECNTFQTECFMLHTKHKNSARWWANEGGDHYYTGQLTRRDENPLEINWIDDLIVCEAQTGKGHGKRIDIDGKGERRLGKTDKIAVYFLRDVMSPFPARGKKGETKIIQGNYAEYLEKKNLGVIMHYDNIGFTESKV